MAQKNPIISPIQQNKGPKQSDKKVATIKKG